MGNSDNENGEAFVDVAERIKKLKHIRSGHKSRVTYFENKLNRLEYKSIGELESALSRLRLTYTKFDDTQTELEMVSEDAYLYRDEFDDDFGSVEAKILNSINELRVGSSSQQNKSGMSGENNLQTSASPKLPNIQLPKFDGSELNWLEFRGIFVELIHSNASLSNVAKFHYLISCVRDGKGHKFVQPFPISNENYPTAWKNVTDYYDDEVTIQKLHIRKIYEIKKPNDNSASSLQYFIDIVLKSYNSLKALKVPVQSWDLLLIHHLSERLDDQSKVAVIKGSPQSKVLTFDKFIEILKERCRILEAQKSSFTSSSYQGDRSQKGSSMKPIRVMSMQKFSCEYCNGDHTLDQCPRFKESKMSPQNRYEIVKKYNLCTNCLRKNHRVIDCTSSPCSLCSLKHHILLHFGRNTSFKLPNRETESNVGANVNSSSSLSSSLSISLGTNLHESSIPTGHFITKNQIILATAVVWVRDSSGDRVQCRALLDSGSQANFVTQSMCKRLSLKTEPVHVRITGINGVTSTATKSVNIIIESRTSDYRSNLSCLIKSKISELLPSSRIRYDQNAIHEHIQLADPWFYKPDTIDLLIGAEIFSEVVSGGKVSIIRDLPMYSTVFGYVIMGRTGSDQNSSESLKSETVSLSVFERLDEKIQRFWLIEGIDNPKTQSIEEKMCEAHYSKNVIRTESGRYSVALPIKSNIGELGNSSINASKQFLTMERRLHRNPELFKQYSQFMAEYFELQHMKVVTNPDQSDCLFKNCYFMPHHAVIRESSLTTKLRVVFNASSKTSSNISLNDCLMVGPTIQQDLCSIILRFRKHVIGITGDIAKMYRQILVHENNQDLQRIWWRESESAPLTCYKLRTVTYGTASAPFLAIRTLLQLAEDELDNFPDASKVLRHDFYVDDVLTGSDNFEAALKLKNDLVRLLDKGGFDLRKITSNHSQVSSSEDAPHSKSVSVLGIQWNVETDKFGFSFKHYAVAQQCTKRSVLSEIAQLFDPLGLCAPVVFVAKSFMQTLWAAKLGWDDCLPSQLHEYWNEYKRQLSSMDEISIPRCVIAPTAKSIELHGFGDASEKGYGCVVYLRSIDHENNVFVNFLCSKSRVAPLKIQSIPRLELCASLLLAQVVDKIVAAMQIRFNSIFLYTDSEITWHRIRSSPGRFETFVANRISKIQDLSVPDDWKYVSTLENPADPASRGLMPQEFLNSALWWKGPLFLNKDVLIIPPQPTSSSPDLAQLEISKVFVESAVKIEEWIPLVRWSDYQKILRIFAYVYRFRRACNDKKITSAMVSDRISLPIEPLQVGEIDGALKFIVKHIQQFHYSLEIHQLRKTKYVSRRSKLLSLAPFLDIDGIIRVGGRLKNSDIPFDHKHQFVMPGTHSFVKLLVRHEHNRLLHAGPQTILYNLRQRFWIIGGRNLCRKVVGECIKCARARPHTLKQIMGQLPETRVQPSRPFQNVGVDFCGPFLTISKLRSRVQVKVYVAIFICFATKAVHIEVVSDLSTSAFLASLRRFVSRRGLCSNIYSDNATNFVGSKSELLDLRRLFLSELHQQEVFKYCLDSHINWHTIPPRSPHFGGLWEAAVKSAKHHIRRVLGYSAFSIEQLNTVVIQIEGCLNSRPLGPMSDDPNDLECLTPGHFLIGQPIQSIPDPSLLHLEFNRLSYFQKIQYTLQKFWKRWREEYLSQLQQRRKWDKPCKPPQIGDLVILKEDNVPPLKWPMARIINVHKGQDGFVRVVTVKTSNSEFKRAITRICPLPVNPEEAQVSD